MPAADYDYSECAESAITVESSTKHIGSAAVTGSVTCEGEQPTYADIYTFEVTAAGTAFSASVDTTADSDMAMTLISPSGCPVAESEAGLTCTGGGDCPSGEATLDEVGTWSVAVEAGWGCFGESVPYTFDIQLGGS